MKTVTYFAVRKDEPGADHVSGEFRVRKIDLGLIERNIAKQTGYRVRNIGASEDGRLIIGRPKQYPLNGKWEADRPTIMSNKTRKVTAEMKKHGWLPAPEGKVYVGGKMMTIREAREIIKQHAAATQYADSHDGGSDPSADPWTPPQ